MSAVCSGFKSDQPYLIITLLKNILDEKASCQRKTAL